MDSDLSGSETPGAILEYIENENKKDVKIVKEKEEKEHKEKDIKEEKIEEKVEIQNNESISQDSNLKEIKKGIFNTFIKGKRIIEKDVHSGYHGNNLVELLKYDDNIPQKIYETLRLSDPSKVAAFKSKLASERKISFAGFIADIKESDNYEANQFKIKLGNGVSVIYDKRYIRKKPDKSKRIEEIIEYFDEAKNNKILWIDIELKEYYLGQKLMREPFVVDYHELALWEKYKNEILNKKEKHKLTFYEYMMCSLVGLNIFDLKGHEKELIDRLYIPRILMLHNVMTPILPKDTVLYTHVLQLTPAATGKTQFALSVRDLYHAEYYDKLPTPANLIYHAKDDVPGSIFRHDYVFIDEFNKPPIDKIIDFINTINTGLSSGEWVIERGNYEKQKVNKYKPVGFGFFGNVLSRWEKIAMNEIDPDYEGIDFTNFEDARKAAQFVLYKKSKDYNIRTAINNFIDRIAVVNIVFETLNLSKLGLWDIAPNPLELYALKQIIQERINQIAKEPEKYIDIEKIDKEQWGDGRMRDNAIKIAIKLSAMEIDKYLGKSVEDLAIEMVKGIWGWNPK
jgi:hypothetical protein